MFVGADSVTGVTEGQPNRVADCILLPHNETHKASAPRTGHDRDGGIVNDPVLLHVDENRWWMQLADSDAGLYAVAAYQVPGSHLPLSLGRVPRR